MMHMEFRIRFIPITVQTIPRYIAAIVLSCPCYFLPFPRTLGGELVDSRILGWGISMLLSFICLLVTARLLGLMKESANTLKLVDEPFTFEELSQKAFWKKFTGTGHFWLKTNLIKIMADLHAAPKREPKFASVADERLRELLKLGNPRELIVRILRETEGTEPSELAEAGRHLVARILEENPGLWSGDDGNDVGGLIVMLGYFITKQPTDGVHRVLNAIVKSQNPLKKIGSKLAVITASIQLGAPPEAKSADCLQKAEALLGDVENIREPLDTLGLIALGIYELGEVFRASGIRQIEKLLESEPDLLQEPARKMVSKVTNALGIQLSDKLSAGPGLHEELGSDSFRPGHQNPGTQ